MLFLKEEKPITFEQNTTEIYFDTMVMIEGNGSNDPVLRIEVMQQTKRRINLLTKLWFFVGCIYCFL